MTGRGPQPGGPDVPESVGRYKITRLLGRGGQGDVYLARHPSLDIDVAVKVLHPEYRREEFIERFSNEARIAARLDVRNIVRVYDFDPEHPYLVMEYCGDGDLSRYIKSRRRRPLQEILSIIRQVLEALVAAHENEHPILHRDLKPSNVLFSKGVPKVADFGLAKALGAGSALTTTRGMMGTIRYCSPEQIKDASTADSRTDLWSVGIILYEMLAWRRPFDKTGDSDSNVMFKVHMEPPAPPPYEIPAPLMNVILHALQKDREQRFPSARLMIAALDEAARQIPGADKLLLPPETVVDEPSRMASEISSLLEQGQSEAAESLLKSLRKKSPDDSVGRFWRDRLKEARDLESRPKAGSSAPTIERRETSWIEARLAAVESLLLKRDYREARRLVGEILYRDPDNTSAQRWLERITEDEKRLREDLDRARQEAGRARDAGDYAKAHQTWMEIDSRYPAMPDIQSELAVAAREKEVHEQTRSREEAARLAGRLQGQGDLKGTLAAWAAHLARYPDDEEALQRHEEMTAALAAHERAERLALLKASAMQRREAGDLPGALALWEGYLLEDPGWEEAAREAQDLRRLIAQMERAARVDEARSKAASRLAAGDARGALREWELLAASYPDATEALDQIAKIRQELAAQERRIIAQEVERLAADLRARAESGRYRSLGGPAGAAVGKAIETARAAQSADAKALASARRGLITAHRDAEALLAAELAKWRREIQRGVAANRDWIPAGVSAAAAGAAAGGAEQARLGEALDRAMTALCIAQGSSGPGDPLEALVGAHRELGEAAAALTGARQKAIDAARKAAAEGIREAQAALDALLKIGAAEGPGSSVDPAPLRERLSKLKEESSSKVPDRLDAVEKQARALAAEAGSARVLALQDLIRELGDLLREGRANLIHLPDEKLETLLGETARRIEPDGAGEPFSAELLVRLRRDLRRELESRRKMINERIAAAEQRWRKADKQWRELLGAGAAGASDDKAGRIVTGGQEALGALRAEELERWAGQLEGLIRRHRLESAWIEQSDAVAGIEGTLGPDGLPEGDLPAEDVELLARYRTAVARGQIDQVRSLAGAIQSRHSRPGQPESHGPVAPAGKVPELSVRARKLNQKYNAAKLKAFDDLHAKYKAAVAGRRAGEAARLAAELARAHRRLVQPPPMWKRLVIPAAVLAVVGQAGFMMMGPGVATTGRHAVKVVSPAGTVVVESLVKDSGRVTDVETRIDEAGVTWLLEPGHYVVTAGGGRREFDVPGESGLLLPGGTRDYLPVLQESLGAGP